LGEFATAAFAQNFVTIADSFNRYVEQCFGLRVLITANQMPGAVRYQRQASRLKCPRRGASDLEPALNGVRSAYISYSPDLAFPGAAQKIESLTQHAIKAGLKHVVLLSGRNEAQAQRCERIVQASGLCHTLVRASWFSQNFSEGHLLAPVLEGMIALPAADVQEPFVDVDDIADVAVAALSDRRRHAGRLYELTGPRLPGFAQAAAEISLAAGRPVQYVAVSSDDFRAGMTPAVGADMAKLFTDLCKEVFDGRNACLADGVYQALGREPRDFSDFCRTTASAGVWCRGSGHALSDRH
jgi:uncharacterized protein YbjT (DUF2867 family)